MIIYKHVPSITNYPVYLGQLDYLLEPFITDMGDATVKKHLKLFFTNVDRTVLDSFSHADIGPKATRAGYLILEVQAELENAIPNISMKYDPEITDDDLHLPVSSVRLRQPSLVLQITGCSKMNWVRITSLQAVIMACRLVVVLTRSAV